MDIDDIRKKLRTIEDKLAELDNSFDGDVEFTIKKSEVTTMSDPKSRFVYKVLMEVSTREWF